MTKTSKRCRYFVTKLKGNVRELFPNREYQIKKQNYQEGY